MDKKNTSAIQCMIWEQICLNKSNIDSNRSKDTFIDTIRKVMINPVIDLFGILYDDEILETFKSRVSVSKSTISGDLGILVNPDLMVTNEKNNEIFAMIDIKQPFLNILPQGGNPIFIDEEDDREIITHLTQYMFASEQRFALLTDALTMTLIELPIGNFNLSDIYDNEDNRIKLRYTTINTSILQKDGQFSGGAEITAFNALEARTAIALMIFGNLENQFSSSHFDQPLKDLAEIMENRYKDHKKKNVQEIALRIKYAVEDFGPRYPHTSNEEERKNDPLLEIYSKPENLGWRAFYVEINSPRKWFTTLISSPTIKDNICENSEIFEITKSTFLKLFNPTKAEMSILYECKSSKLILKSYTQNAGAVDYYENRLDLGIW